MIESMVKANSVEFNLLCGVPYTALPLASVLSLSMNLPMIMRRKEAKNYGMKKIIEGSWDTSIKNRCLIIEDLVTSGLSVFETIEPINECGIDVSDIVVILDREQGGRLNIEKRNCKLHSLLTMSQVCDVLESKQRISHDKAEQVRAFIRANQVSIDAPSTTASATQSLAPTPRAQSPSPAFPKRPFTYEARAALCSNPQSKALLNLMHNKRTNLCVSADVTTADELLAIADSVGPYMCMLKTHADCLIGWNEETVEKLTALSKKHQFLIFEDRKFADIGSTVTSQYRGGVHRISSWSHITNAHLIPGPGIISGLKIGSLDRDANERSGLLLIAEMSSAGQLATGEYTEANVKAAESQENRDFVMGFICQRKLSNLPHLIHCTPGVNIESTGDSLGQQYNTPAAVMARGTDVIIVGRAIYGTKGQEAVKAAEYQKQGWEAYVKSLQ